MSEHSKNTVQTFVVQQLAMYNTPQEIARLVKEIFDQEISRQLVASYDPSKPNYSAGKKWKALFYRERESHLSDVKKIPVANQAYRLRVIQNQIDRLLSSGGSTNVKLLQSLLEQAAKEIGGMYANKREVAFVPPTPLEIARELYRELISEEDFTEEEAMAFVTERYHLQSSQILDSEFLFDRKDD